MAQKFKLVERRNLGKDAATTPRKVYAQAINNGYVGFDELCSDISELCSLTSADVKAVMEGTLSAATFTAKTTEGADSVAPAK